MGTTSGCASDKIAEKTNAVLCAEGELAGRELADRQILQVPFPTGDRTRDAPQEPVRICRSEQLDGRAHALAARFEKPCLEKSQHRHADIAQQASHRRQHVGATRVGEQQGQAVQQPLWIALQDPGQRRIERAVGDRRVHNQRPPVIAHQPVNQGIQVFVLGVARKFFEAEQNVFKAEKITAHDCDASEGLEESGQ